MKEYESAEQEAIFQWAEYSLGKYPELKLLHHIANGGKRDALEAASLKRQGVKAVSALSIILIFIVIIIALLKVAD